MDNLRVIVQAPTQARLTLPATKASLAAAGMTFEVWSQKPGSLVIEHLISILEAAPPNGHLLRLEDDIEVGRFLLKNLEAWSQRDLRVAGFLFHAPKAPGNLRGREQLRPPKPTGDFLAWPFGTYLYGACGLLLRSDVAAELAAELRRLTIDPPPTCWSRRAGRLMQDQSLCEAAARLSIPVVSHWPPLIEHRGNDCSTWRGSPYPLGTGSTNGLWSLDYSATGASNG